MHGSATKRLGCHAGDEIRAIVFLTHMHEHDHLQPIVDQSMEETGRVAVRQMAAPPANALLHLRRVRTIPKHVGTVIRFQDQPMRAVQPLANQLGHIPHVARDPQTQAAARNHVTHRVGRVVAHAEALDLEVATYEPVPRLKYPNIRQGANRHGQAVIGKRRHVYGHLEPPGEGSQAQHVIPVLVGDKYPGEPPQRFTYGLHARVKTLETEPAIDENLTGA